MERLPANIARRFWRKAKRVDYHAEKARKPLVRPCLEWQGGVDNKGYGVFRAFPGCMGLKSGIVRAHRLSYWLANGPFPRNAQIDHECGNKRCLEPSHLKLVGIAEHGRLSRSDQLNAEIEEEILQELKDI